MSLDRPVEVPRGESLWHEDLRQARRVEVGKEPVVEDAGGMHDADERRGVAGDELLGSLRLRHVAAYDLY